ncbi:DUF1538 family protein [Candidatus Electronema sp. JC]|uniref:DUF1538 family protein n=1 Tax=Candidatus Electronema sp. JC TaxID=3401570 RepID=UPI003B42FCA3
MFRTILKKLWSAFADLIPIIAVISFFQLAVIRQPLPDLGGILFGVALVTAGLALFVEGLEIGLFPIGEGLAEGLARKGSLFWLLLFAFVLGFSTTIAEPALIAVAAKAGETASKAGLLTDEQAVQRYALGLRLTVAAAVGTAVLTGVLRILRGWPIHYLILGGYMLVMLMSMIAPKEIIGIACDVGGVTTSSITVPLVTALGVGLAAIIRGRNPMTDGFGLIAFTALLPTIFVMGYGLILFR